MGTLEFVSAFFVLGGMASAFIIFIDIRAGHRQSMRVMEVVWPLTGLWGSWIGLWGYFAAGRGRARGGEMAGMEMAPRGTGGRVAFSTLHCGAGCSLADLIGEWFTFFIPVGIGGSFIAGQWVLDYALALGLGVVFQFAAIQSMERLGRGKALWKASRVDFLSLTAWQLGMYGWMAMALFVFPGEVSLPKTGWSFWFMMQVAMCFGFLTAYPVNWLLVRRGVKRGM